jgi:2-hydroxychromene-2-carboxylate isomerase
MILKSAENGDNSVRRADWFFDYISPYAYLQFHKLDRLPSYIELHFRPVLFAGLLNHWGQLGPAEILAKKRHTFLLTRWRAQKLGLPFRPPPRHPFNPLALLRLTLALGSDRTAIGKIFDHVWAEGRDAQDPEVLEALAKDLGIQDLAATTSDPAVKDALRTNTEDAVASGIYGVPSFLISEQIFWGDDMFDLMLEWLEDPSVMGGAKVFHGRSGIVPLLAD